MTPMSIVVWFSRAYEALGFDGCSSHSGRRTFITRAARVVHKAGGSLRDVQLLAGHRSIQTTQRYIVSALGRRLPMGTVLGTGVVVRLLVPNIRRGLYEAILDAARIAAQQEKARLEAAISRTVH